MENYVGKIVKISGTDSWGRDFATTGLVYAQREGFRGDSTVFSLIKTNGSVADTVAVMHNDNAKITSTKIEPELRAALKEAYRMKLKLDSFEEKYNKELAAHKDAFKNALTGVKENSNELTSNEFIDAVLAEFEKRYPSSGDYYRKYFTADSWSSTEISVKQVQDIEKWASPEGYSFLFREYDNTIHMRYDSKELKDFCERNAPRVIPELAKHCKTDVSASLGDKQWLSVERIYTFPIKYGYSKKSIEEIKERLFGKVVKKPSLSSQMNDAMAKNPVNRVSKNKEQVFER